MAINPEATQMSREAPTDWTLFRMPVGVMKMPEPMIWPKMYEVAPQRPIMLETLGDILDKSDLLNRV